MKEIHFLISDELNEQIEELMSQLNIYYKSVFFRELARQSVKENNIAPQKTPVVRQEMPKLSPDEAAIIGKLHEKEKTIDEITTETGLHVSEVSSLLVQLLLKKLVQEEHGYWKLI